MLYATVRQRVIEVKKPKTVIQNGVNVDFVMLAMDQEWNNMESIVCVFKNADIEQETTHKIGTPLPVPAECLKQTGQLTISLTGYVNGEKVMTTKYPDSCWEIVANGPMTADAPLSPKQWPGWNTR